MAQQTHTDEPQAVDSDVLDALEGVIEDASMSDDVEYLAGLLLEAVEDEHDAFDSDYERALWAVSQWCQELNVVPDLDAYETGETVPKGDQRGQHPRADQKYHIVD